MVAAHETALQLVEMAVEPKAGDFNQTLGRRPRGASHHAEQRTGASSTFLRDAALANSEKEKRCISAFRHGFLILILIAPVRIARCRAPIPTS
jgi:hypothetical protein